EVGCNSPDNPEPENVQHKYFGFHLLRFGSHRGCSSYSQPIGQVREYPKRKFVFQGSWLHKPTNHNLLYFWQKQGIASHSKPKGKSSNLCGLRLVFLYREYTSCLHLLG